MNGQGNAEAAEYDPDDHSIHRFGILDGKEGLIKRFEFDRDNVMKINNPTRMHCETLLNHLSSFRLMLTTYSFFISAAVIPHGCNLICERSTNVKKDRNWIEKRSH